MKEKGSIPRVRLCALTVVALVAFAGNSVLCRVALKGELIAADLFTLIRVVAGAVVLWVLVFVRSWKKKESERAGKQQKGSWLGAVFLMVYMVAFSRAYLGLETGAGALILFGAVQVTMIGWASMLGQWPSGVQLVGLVIAIAGLAWLLLLPGTQAPPLGAGMLMILAGGGWGAYTLRGRGVQDPLGETAGNFLKAVLFVLVLLMSSWQAEWSGMGVGLALVSGALTSAIGYAIWYEALRGLSATRAAGLQLLVPVLASAGGLIFGGEAVTMRMLFSSVLVLGGVALVLRTKEG